MLIPVRGSFVCAACCVATLAAPSIAHAAASVEAADELDTRSEDLESEESEEVEGFYDPRLRTLPRKHRFRMGLQVQYMRLSSALDEESGRVQKFHYVPLQLDFAYQGRIGQRFMVRPGLAVGGNVGNSLEAMPILLQPNLFAGLQGRMFGVALGYGFLVIPVQNKDARSAARGGLGQPILRHGHQIGGEVSITTRVHKRRESAPGAGEFSFIFRVSGVNSRNQHFDVNTRRWRAMVTFNVGWYFGDGRRRRAQRAASSSS